LHAFEDGKDLQEKTLQSLNVPKHANTLWTSMVENLFNMVEHLRSTMQCHVLWQISSRHKKENVVIYNIHMEKTFKMNMGINIYFMSFENVKSILIPRFKVLIWNNISLDHGMSILFFQPFPLHSTLLASAHVCWIIN
jgi:hypothetical protein